WNVDAKAETANDIHERKPGDVGADHIRERREQPLELIGVESPPRLASRTSLRAIGLKLLEPFLKCLLVAGFKFLSREAQLSMPVDLADTGDRPQRTALCFAELRLVFRASGADTHPVPQLVEHPPPGLGLQRLCGIARKQIDLQRRVRRLDRSSRFLATT